MLNSDGCFYLLKINNRNTRTRCEICSKLAIKTPERCQWCRPGVFIVNFEHIPHFVLVFLLLTLNMSRPTGIIDQLIIYSRSEHYWLNYWFLYDEVEIIGRFSEWWRYISKHLKTFENEIKTMKTLAMWLAVHINQYFL